MKKIMVILLAAVLLILAACAGKSGDGTTKAPTEPPTEAPVEITTENREKTGAKKNADEITLKDTGLNITLSVPIPGARVSSIDDGSMFVYTDITLDRIKEIIDALTPEGELKVYPYDGALRVEYLAVSGDLVTYTILDTIDAKGEKAYLFCDSRAFFSDGADYYATVKFPYFYLLDTDAFTPTDYVRLGDSFRISVAPEDFRAFYAESGIYALKEGVGTEFSLEFPYYDADAQGYPLRFTFSNDAEGFRTVTVDRGTVEQVTDKY